ncbi:hypothetical protein A3D88_01370 [Candidatus Peribacteria bacterium RIFCSPHIGHO2_02_FULL_52_16]|nr:MAG: hypothetical protein A2706_03610 [Candidatus Peribacteria bacterium RIFCSPHIGHO2_01_FULL_51_35]OGJ60969.1 MAG: hypothetical protein A3D88_01370 [Candidatus Peribacteria bacterium RIFCSPHIGHO2_02_FULL_52_16]
MIFAVIPAFNEATRIAHVIRDAKKYAARILVVDDGSTDQTAAVSEQEGATIVRHIQNGGAGAATMTGIEAARVLGATIIITLDADGQHDPADIPLLLKPVQDGIADIVFANRFGQRNHIPFIRRVANGIGNVVTFLTTGKWVSDSQCGFKVLGPRAIQEIDLRMSGFEFCSEIVRECVQHKWRAAQIPTKVLYSEYTLAKGQSFSNGIKTALKILLRSFLR